MITKFVCCLQVSSVERILILSNTILVVGEIRGNILVRMKTLGDDILSYTLKVCLSVATTPSLQTVVNVFLVNLAVADIMVLSFCAPFFILQVLIFPSFLYICNAILNIKAFDIFGNLINIYHNSRTKQMAKSNYGF